MEPDPSVEPKGERLPMILKSYTPFGSPCRTQGLKRSPRKRTSIQSAFTLIELLTVIAIMVVLAAILFPVFAQAKEAAKKASCINQLKQLSIAVLLYAGDYDDMMVDTTPINEGGGKVLHWFGRATTGSVWSWDLQGGRLQPYIKNNTVVTICPAGLDLAFYPSFNIPITYGMSTNLFEGLPSNDRSLSYASNPAETLLFSDSATVVPTLPAVMYRTHTFAAGQLGTGMAHARHSNKTVVGWLDGHAKVVPITFRTRDLNVGLGYTAANWRNYNVGDVLKYELQYQNPAPSPTFSARDKYYYLMLKPAGL